MKQPLRTVAVVAAAVSAVVLCACGETSLLPDGGRARLICQGSTTVISVKTVDLAGQPVPAAQVVATNQGNGKVVTGETNGAGISTALTDEIGSGQIEIKATAGALKSQSFVVQVTCGECDCTVMPGSATLILQ